MATGTCFLNVDEAVLEWAWKQYDDTATKRQRALHDKERVNHQKYLRALIDWSDVRCTHIHLSVFCCCFFVHVISLVSLSVCFSLSVY